MPQLEVSLPAKFSIRMERKLHRKFRRACFDREIPMCQKLSDLAEEWLTQEEERSVEKKQRFVNE